MYRHPFIPPRDNAFVRSAFRAMLPVVGQAIADLRHVTIEDEDVARLKSAAPGRAILAPNHPTIADPMVMLWVSARVGEPFNFLAAREILDGWRGWVLNRLGAYSVLRGTADRESIRTTRRLLAEMDRKVVIFPEGEIYEYNDALLAFQTGVAQMGFWALDDLGKAGRDVTLPLFPIAVKYRCCDAPRAAIENSLRRLEDALGLSADRKLGIYGRILRIGGAVLTRLEDQEQLHPTPDSPLAERIQALREKALVRVASAIGVRLDRKQPPADQLHQLFNSLQAWVGFLPEQHTPYEVQLHHRRASYAAPLFQDLERLQSFIAVTGDYVASEPTAERVLQLLNRLEREVHGRVIQVVPREALVRVGEPIRLERRYDDYRARRRETVQQVTVELEGKIRELLHSMSAHSTRIDLDG